MLAHTFLVRTMMVPVLSVLVFLPANAQEATPQPVIASTDGEDDGTRIEVREFKRSGNTLTLKFTIINDNDTAMKTYGKLVGDGYAGTRNVAGVHLVDTANKKKYLVIKDAEGNCVCTKDLEDIPPKSRRNAWAKFPAPPAEVKSISLVVPRFIPVDDVPISQ